MDSDQPKQPATPPAEPGIYPTPSKGSLSDNPSTPDKPIKWAGSDPDKGMRAYFIGFLLLLLVLFILAIKTLSGGKFWF